MQIKTYSPKSHKIKAVIYWPSGSWKTTIGGTAPKPIFASAEGGLLSIAHLKPAYAEIKSLDDLKELLVYLKKWDHAFETVIIDSITEINEIIKMDIEKKTWKAMQLQDWGTLAKRIREILRGFRDLDMHVLFIAQESIDKDGDKIERIMPNLNGKASNEIAYFMDIVWYMTIEPGTWERKVLTQTNLKYVTKDRTGKIWNNTAPDFWSWVEKVKDLEISNEDILYSVESDSDKLNAKIEIIEFLLSELGYWDKMEEWLNKAASIVKKKAIWDLSLKELEVVSDNLSKKIEEQSKAKEDMEEPEKPSKSKDIMEKQAVAHENIKNDPQFQEAFGETEKSLDDVIDEMA